MNILTKILLIFTFFLTFYFVSTEFYLKQFGCFSVKHFSEAVQRCSIKKVLLKFFQNWQEITVSVTSSFWKNENKPCWTREILKTVEFFLLLQSSDPFHLFWLNDILKICSLACETSGVRYIKVRLKGAKFHSLVLKAHTHTGCFTACMGAHFLVVQLDNTIQFSNESDPSEGVRVPLA